MSTNQKNIASRVRELVSDEVARLGYEIWDVEYVKEGAYWYLRITIDKQDGIDVNDCEKVNRAIDPIIDEADPIEEQYFLEVSSPGLERELKRPEHFEKCIGENVEVKLFSALDGAKQYAGTLVSYNGESVTVNTNGENKLFDIKNVSKISIQYDFDSDNNLEEIK